MDPWDESLMLYLSWLDLFHWCHQCNCQYTQDPMIMSTLYTSFIMFQCVNPSMCCLFSIAKLDFFFYLAWWNSVFKTFFLTRGEKLVGLEILVCLTRISSTIDKLKTTSNNFVWYLCHKWSVGIDVWYLFTVTKILVFKSRISNTLSTLPNSSSQ